MDISVIVPFYNEEGYVEQCVQALLSQDYPKERYEVILVDNNSSDRSAEIVRRYPGIKLLSEGLQGDFAARNRGLAAATGKLVAFTDSNCAPEKDWLRGIAAAMLDPGLGIVLGRVQFACDSAPLSMMAAYESEKAAYILSSNNKEIYVGCTSNMTVRKALFDRIGPFSPVFRNSDIVFVRKAVDEHSCGVVGYFPEISVRHLEISDLRGYYRKLLTYGQDYQRYGKVASVRPLNSIERLGVFKKTIQNQRYSPGRSVLLFLLLSLGGLCYDLARWRANSGPKPPMEPVLGSNR